MKYIVTNFAYGTGPYLRTTELALAFNYELEQRGHERLGIIIPWVYGEKQKRIILEEFSEYEQKHPGEMLLDKELGELLKSIFYGNNMYEQALAAWIEKFDVVSNAAHKHLSGTFEVETLSSEKYEANGKDIVVELNRSPRIIYNVAPSYFTSFAYIADILEQAIEIPTIATDKNLLRSGISIAQKVESAQKLHCTAYPATFSYSKSYKPRYQSEVFTPPIFSPPQENHDEFDPGIFVTITGIPGLERLYEEAKQLGLRLYSNDTKAVPGSEKKLPWIVPNKNTVFQFARSGWGSVWLSMLSSTPIVVPEFDAKDDPEIYFNNRAIEEMGIGIVYRGQPLQKILDQRERVQKASAKIKNEILARWETLDGNLVCAKRFVNDFLKK